MLKLLKLSKITRSKPSLSISQKNLVFEKNNKVSDDYIIDRSLAVGASFTGKNNNIIFEKIQWENSFF